MEAHGTRLSYFVEGMDCANCVARVEKMVGGLPGTGEVPAAPVFIDGERTVTLKGDHIAEEFQAIVEDYVARRYGAGITHQE